MRNTAWEFLSNLWDSFLNKGLFEHIWAAYEEVLGSVRRNLFQANLAKGIELASPYQIIDWGVFKLNEDNMASEGVYEILKTGTIEINQFQDGIEYPENVYYNNIDFAIDGIELTWLNITEDHPVPVDVDLWAVNAKIYDTRIAKNFGVLVGEESQDSHAYLEAVKGLMHSYWMGPEIRHIRNGLNIILEGQYFQESSVVSFVDPVAGVVKVNLPSGEVKSYLVDINSDIVPKVGDKVNKFDLITDTVEVLDYIKDPRWWDRFGVGIIDETSGVIATTPEDEDLINSIAKRFIWAIKIDADKFDEMNSEIGGMIARFLDNVEPAYTNHVVVLSNDFYSGQNGDYFKFDDYDGNEEGMDISIEYEVGLDETISFNEVSNLIYNDYASHNLGYDEYHTEEERAYNLDNDVLSFTEELNILET